MFTNVLLHGEAEVKIKKTPRRGTITSAAQSNKCFEEEMDRESGEQWRKVIMILANRLWKVSITWLRCTVASIPPSVELA